jgi:hypothetical protein
VAALDRADDAKHHESENGHGGESVENGDGKYDVRHGFFSSKIPMQLPTLLLPRGQLLGQQ